MGPDDASSADMRRPPANPDADPLALDEDTVEELLTGALPPPQAPAGYTKVAQLLAAAAAAPTPEELAGQGAVLAEFRAMARARPAAVLAPGRARLARRRRRRGLAVAIVVGALATGGVAGAATGHLPGPVRDAARAITGAETGTGTGTPAGATTGQPSTSATGIPNASGSAASRPGGAPGSGSGSAPGSTGAGPAAGPAVQGLCEAYAAGNGVERGGKLDASAFEELVAVAGGEEKVAAYCEDLLPGDQKLLKKTKNTKPPEQPRPSGSGPPASTGGTGGQGQGGPPPEGNRAP
jgi:hypothetical protein